MKKVFIVLFILLVGFLGYVSSRPGTFKYERSGVIQASADKIFPYLHNFKKGNEWVPYQKMDPTMKQTYSGPEEGVGSKMEFKGSPQVGEGNLEITKEVTNSSVEMRLEMIKPIQGINTVVYTLTPEGNGTRFTWAMSGKNPFLGKLIGVFIDCEKMVGGQFEQGIQSLKTIVESNK